MRKTFLPLILGSLLTFAVSCGNNQNDSTDAAKEQNEQKRDSNTATGTALADSTKSDQNFLVEAASGGLMEVELGRVAQTNASSAKVKEFGQRMVTDHTKANDELKAVAASKNITIPTTPGEDQQKHIDELKGKKGADFDKAYMSMMVDDHNEDVSAFDKEANNGNDPDIKAFAAKTLPVLKEHLQMAKTTNDGLKK